jgi:mediator of RNA polymerase II transcription subunit 12
VSGTEHGRGIKPSALIIPQTASPIYDSPDVLRSEEKEEDYDSDRPAKRVKVGENVARVDQVNQDHDSGDESSAALHAVVAGSTLPHMPKSSSTAIRKNAHGDRDAKTLQSRQAVDLTPPSMATRIPTAKAVADFSPWNGRHPEDNLTETVIRNGYFDKAPGPNSTESASACAIIWPGLAQKNSVALSMLSTIFASAMEKRQQLGKHTAPSAFKPPPRVTITDSKREAWLRDLANPAVPLRRQARNIPYGIRGKILMEQCAAKNIPLARAVWLAKCVGANELRAFRRKGAGNGTAATAAMASGELKWTREWTVHVLQFLESVILTCGQTPDWKARMDYAVRLTASFYVERLVEREIFLDWLVTSLHPEDGAPSATALNRLPIWILLIQLYWKDLVSRGRRGRKLAQALLENLHRIESYTTHTTPPVFEPLKARLRGLISSFRTADGSACLILPRAWPRYQYLLTTFPGFQHVILRIQRLSSPSTKTSTNTRCALLKLYSHLDNLPLDPDFANLLPRYSACLDGEVTHLVRALLDWAASTFRQGLDRVFVTHRFLALLRRSGHDTDAAILAYFRVEGTADEAGTMVKMNVWRVVIELVRDGLFGVGGYLQWMLSNGVLNNARPQSGRADDLSLATGLLLALSNEALPTNLVGTHQMLLKRLLRNLARNGAKIPLAENVEAAVKTVSSQDELASASFELPSGPGRLAISMKLIAQVQGINTAHNNSDECLRRFLALRTILEDCLDLRTLGGLLHTLIPSKSVGQVFLATIVDTISIHAGAFAALGQLKPLFEGLIMHYRTLRSSQPLDRTLVIALAGLTGDLTSDIRNRSRDASERTFHAAHALLLSDLALCGVGGPGSIAATTASMAAGISATVQAGLSSASAVCSPASDNLLSIASVNQKPSDTPSSEANAKDPASSNISAMVADIDAVFASGNSMDDGLMRRLFARIVACAGLVGSPDPMTQSSRSTETSNRKAIQHAKTQQQQHSDSPMSQSSRLCYWLSQLRRANPTNFDMIISEHIQTNAAKSSTSEQFLHLGRALVVSGCVSMGVLIDRILTGTTTNASGLSATATAPISKFFPTDLDSNLANLALKLFCSYERTASIAFPLTITELYHFRILCRRYSAAHSAKLLSVIVAAAASSDFVGRLHGESAHSPAFHSVLQLILECAPILSTNATATDDASALAKERAKAIDRSPVARTQYSSLLETIWQPHRALGTISDGDTLQPDDVVRSASPLSIPFAAEFLALQQVSVGSTSAISTESTSFEDNDTALRVQSAIVDAIRAGSEVWPQLLQCSGRATKRKIYDWAVESVLAIVSQPSTTSPKDTTRVLEILDVAYHDISDELMDHVPIVIATIVGKLRAFETTLVAMGSAHTGPDAPQAQQQQRHDIHGSLSILLHLSILYSSVAAESNNESGQETLTKPPTILSAAGTGTISTPTNATDENETAAAQHSQFNLANRDLLVVLCSILPRLCNMSHMATVSSSQVIAQKAPDHSSSTATTTTQHLLQDLSLLGGGATTDKNTKDDSSSTSENAVDSIDPSIDIQVSVLDVARFLADNLSEALLASVPRLLPPIARADPRIRTLLGPDADGNVASTTAIGFASFALALPAPVAATNPAGGSGGNSMSAVFGGNSSGGSGIWSPLSSTSAASFSFPVSSPSQPQTTSQQQQQQMAMHQMQMQQRQQMAQQQNAMQRTLSPAAKARQSAATAGAGAGAGANTTSLQHQQQLFQQQHRNANHQQSPSKSNSKNLPHLSLSRPDLYVMPNNNNNTPSSPSSSLPPTSTSSTSATTASATGPGGCRYVPFNFKTWENIPPVHVGGAGGNDTETSLGLGLFAARRV